MHIRIGNLNIMTTPRQLAELFVPFGRVRSSKIVFFDSNGRSQGTGFIEIDSFAGNQALKKLHLLLFMNSYIELEEEFQPYGF